MSETMLGTHGLSKSFGALRVTDDVSLAVAENELHAIIGPNGAGKTTLLAQLFGEVSPDRGTIEFAGHDITRRPPYERARMGIARSFQITTLCADFTAEDNVALAVQAREPHGFAFWRPTRTDAALREPARELLGRVGLGARAALPSRVLSHGEHRQLEIAVALALEPRVLLLDEPLAGVGIEESRGLVQILQALKGTMTIVLVEHDVGAVEALADRVTVLDGGRAIATGTFAQIRSDAAVRRAYLGDAE
ncbi:MAG TPA: ABC transporter ATP-binding protein [Candidatus Binatia bacterium]|nr:ABC transporter ATP-binding protein [Candidatus Binatia bacterium]